MAGLLYFLPNIQSHQLAQKGRLSPAILAARGLADALVDCPLADHHTLIDFPGRGPGGHSGLFVIPTPISGEPASRLGFFPDVQEWRPAFRDPEWDTRLWIGFNKEEPPTPDGLRRRTELIAGKDLTLLDEQSWHVPLIRRPAMGEHPPRTSLPLDLEVDASGKTVKSIQAKHQALWAETIEMTAHRFGQATVTDDQAFGFAMRVLGLNYRVSQAEQNVLRILDSHLVIDVLDAAIDLEFVTGYVRECVEQKKTSLSPGESTTPGSTGDTPTTDPPAES